MFTCYIGCLFCGFLLSLSWLPLSLFTIPLIVLPYQVVYSYRMIQPEKKQPKLLTFKQASGLLNRHPNTLREWDAKGYFVAVRFSTRRDRRINAKM